MRGMRVERLDHTVSHHTAGEWLSAPIVAHGLAGDILQRSGATRYTTIPKIPTGTTKTKQSHGAVAKPLTQSGRGLSFAVPCVETTSWRNSTHYKV
jgi:hypothetical protein